MSILINHRYTLGPKLGEGGMGTVHEGQHVMLERPVVIKLMHPHYTADETAVSRFFVEARAAARLDHPNTVRIFDFGSCENHGFYIAMEKLDGPTLGELMKSRKRLPTERVISIVRDILASLAEAHAVGVVHRDLKPGNIIVTREGTDEETAKVLDFGLAKILEPAFDGLTQAGMVCGTPEYMSPEQSRGEAVSTRSDLYAVGVLLFELLTGEVPFEAPSPVAVLLKHVNEPPPAPRALCPQLDIPAELEALCLRLLAKDPQARPATANEVIKALDAIAQRRRDPQPAKTEPVKPAPPQPVAKPPAKRPKSNSASTRPSDGMGTYRISPARLEQLRNAECRQG